MAELSARIIAKASGTASEEPLAADLEVAELAVNTADGKLFTKHTDGSVVTISGGGGGGAVDSVNGETGEVSLGIQDMNDYAQNEVLPVAFQFSTFAAGGGGLQSSGVPANPGEWAFDPNFNIRFANLALDGTSLRDAALAAGGVFPWISIDGINFQQATEALSTGSSSYLSLAIGSAPSGMHPYYDVQGGTQGADGDYFVAFSEPGTPTPVPLAEGDVLQWNDSDQEFKPAQLPDATATRVSLGIGEYTDDAAAGTGGVASGAMYYNTTSSDYRLKS